MPLLIILISLIFLVINQRSDESLPQEENKQIMIASNSCEQGLCNKGLGHCSKETNPRCKEKVSKHLLQSKEIKANKSKLNYP